MTQKRHELLTKAILIFVFALSVNLIFKPTLADANFCRCAYSLKAGDNKIECYTNTEGCESWKSDLYADPAVNVDITIFCAELDDCGRWPLMDRKKNTAASTIGCCQIYQGGPLNKCWNTSPENCLKGNLEERRLFQTQACSAISDCSDKIASANESICDQAGCRVCDPNKGCRPSQLSDLLVDLNARKPVLEINIPGLKFSDVVSSTDETGTYFYISWIPELISAVYKFGIAIISIVAVVVIIIQGLRIVASGGGEAKASAYKKILQSVIGLMIAWGSFAILYNVNPALVQFNALKVRVVEGQESPNPIIELEEKVSSATEPSTLPPGNYDFLFQKYANCVGINWRVLKMIALGENSKLNPAKVNDAGFIGFFQVRPDFCPAKFKGKYAKYADKCTIENLKTPAFNTAVGALYQKDTVNLINTYCKNGDVALQLQIFYSVLNTGFGGTTKILQYAKSHGGCTENNLREGSRVFWRTKDGGSSARWFIGYYEKKDPNYCQEFTDKLDCMGTRKFNHTFAAAKRGIASQGITSFLIQSPGICPLDTDTPFPSS